MNREKKLIKNTFILTIGAFLPKFTVLITLPIYTAMLTKAEFGTYDLINTLVLLLIPTITLQLQIAAFRFLIDFRDAKGEAEVKKIISTVYCFVGVISVVSLIIVYFFLAGISFQIRLLICLYLLLEILLEVTKQIVRGLGDMKTFSFSTAIHAAANVVFVVLLMSLMKMGLAGLLISLNIAMVAAILFILLRVNVLQYFSFRFFNKAVLKDLLRYSTPLVPNIISLYVITAAGRLLTAAYIGVEAVAVFAVANKIPSLLGQVYGVFNLSWQENASETHEDKDSGEYYSEVFTQLFNLLSGVTAVLIASTPIVFAILIRGSYDEAYPQILILYLGVFFNCLMSFYGGIYVASKRTLAIGLTSMLGAVVSVVINWIFIQHIGLYAASIAMLVSYVALFVFRLIHTRRWKKIEYDWKRMGLCLAALVVMSALCFQRMLVLDIANFVFGTIFAVALNKTLLMTIYKKARQRYSKKHGDDN